MKIVLNNFRENAKIIIITKILVCLAVIFYIVGLKWNKGIDSYCQYKDYFNQFELTDSEAISLGDISEIKQRFTAKGNILNNVSIVTGQLSGEKYNVSIQSIDNKVVANIEVDASDLIQFERNNIGLSTDRLKRGIDYYIVIQSDEGLGALFSSIGPAPENYKICYADGNEIKGKLVCDMSFTYRYMPVSSIAEICFNMLFDLFLTFIICTAVVLFEKIYVIERA